MPKSMMFPMIAQTMLVFNGSGEVLMSDSTLGTRSVAMSVAVVFQGLYTGPYLLMFRRLPDVPGSRWWRCRPPGHRAWRVASRRYVTLLSGVSVSMVLSSVSKSIRLSKQGRHSVWIFMMGPGKDMSYLSLLLMRKRRDASSL